ncbi:alanine racemase [uncultured Mycolicibacterium sp.]|uniref:alanine racemase n=1 Tax=uncultured Mycolicibacterium sp. TaxID=2320817 RepID=UPI00261050F9|nr:alanine racemase [uncultured Mycolicibacterium sp.]
MDHAPHAVVDLAAIAHNVRLLARHAAPAAVMAVVKADGYGHGAVPVARAALRAGAAELGVATVDEALQLRRAGIAAPVLAWLHHPGTDFAAALAADVQLAVSSAAQLDAVVAAARRGGRTATVTVKVDTGLHRNGLTEPEFRALLDALRAAAAAGAVRVRGLMSHLACADEPDHPANTRQLQRFTAMRRSAAETGVHFEVAHLANSAATLTRPDLRLDLVRCGLAVYGMSPVPDRGDFGLVPAMTLTAPVALVKRVRAGEGVSYGHTWIAERDTTVGLIPLGYADGVPRSLGGRIEVLINGRRCPSIGRVCMDQFVVDLGPDGAGVRAGDRAVLFGQGKTGELTAQDWAERAGTISYEVLTGPRGRVVRRYRD